MSPRRQGLVAFLRRRLGDPDYPLLAVEVRPGTLGVVRLERRRRQLALGAATVLDLPPGCLAPSLTEPNILAPDAFEGALRAALERTGAAGAARACLVLPDPVGRVALLDPGELRGKRRHEAGELIRFRLRKALPFDVREARLAWHAPSAADVSAGSLPVLAMERRVIEQYEGALAAVGLHAGLVELSGLVCLEAAQRGRPPGEDHLAINWDQGYLSLFLTRAGRLAVARTLPLPEDSAASVADVQREVFNTVTYYRERLGGTGLAAATLRSALVPVDEAAGLLAEPLGLAPHAFDPCVGTAHRAEPVPAALATALAAVVGRAA